MTMSSDGNKTVTITSDDNKIVIVTMTMTKLIGRCEWDNELQFFGKITKKDMRIPYRSWRLNRLIKQEYKIQATFLIGKVSGSQLVNT